ncbi:MAG: recombinase zinc beta ribbon domain-containing protein [Myxococcales bacterium]|nr:recombinase zinc beta ribbon domain-containing protein [Myxococcales bacterium]
MRCGHCGRRMYVNYGGERAVRTLQYRCSRPLAAVAGQDCQLIGGKRIEALVVEAFLDVSAAAGIEAAALAGETLRLEIEATERPGTCRSKRPSTRLSVRSGTWQ